MEQKHKVLLVAPVLDIGGAEKVIRDIAWFADPEKYEITLLILRHKVGIYEEQLLARGCRSVHVDEPSDNYFAYLKALMGLMKRERFDIVHVHTMFSCGWVMLAARLCGVPVRITHSHSALDDGSGLVKTVYEKLMRFLILTCSTDLVGCGIKAGKRLFGEKAWEKRGQLIVNGVDIASFAFDGQKRNEIRTNLGLGERFVLGHAGHLIDVKNQKFLLELMPDILKQRPNAVLLLLGEGPDRPMLEEKIREMGLENHVTLTGNVTNVADYLSAMDVFVFPSLFEGLPLSILEVQANGLPCVISDRVPEDVFLTDLIHPLPLEEKKEVWVEKILSAHRGDTERYNLQLRESDYAVERAMAKIYRIYDKRNAK